MKETSKEYAEALYLLAAETGTAETTRQALHEIDGIFRENPEFLELLYSPGLEKTERISVLQKTFAGSFPEHVVSLCALLCEKGRIRDFSECVAEFESLYEDAHSYCTAMITSAVPLSENEKEELLKKLRSVSKKDVTPIWKTDESLIGGVIVELDGKIIDGSLKRRLREVKEVIQR